MASFIMHNIAGELFLKTIEKRYGFDLDEDFKNKFLLGNLIADSSKLHYDGIWEKGKTPLEIIKLRRQWQGLIQLEKSKTHFRDPADSKLCIQVPKLEKFIDKYARLLEEDVSSLGYLFHLYTDKFFFENLLGNTVVCLDKERKETKSRCDSCFMKIKKNNKIYLVKDFWDRVSDFSIYSDYTRMNRMLLSKYDVKFDKKKLVTFAVKKFVNQGIEEVDYGNIFSVLNKVESYFEESVELGDDELKVFEEELVWEFIDKVVINFIKDYEKLVIRLLGLIVD